jgi:TolB-like protein
MMKKPLIPLFVIYSLFGLAFGQNSVQLAVLPFSSLGVDDASTLTAHALLSQELARLGRFTIMAEKQVVEAAGQKSCFEKECALTLGQALQADQVLLCSLNRLGEKVIVQYLLLEVKSGSTLLNDNTTSNTIEDLETVMKRVALCVYSLKPFSETGQVGLITQKETDTPERKTARKYMGLSFGYLYPQNGYDNAERSFAMDLRTGYEMNRYTIGSQLAAQKGFAWNIYASYLLSVQDLCPYVGGAFGFHWVSHEQEPIYYIDQQNGYYNYQEDKRKGDGFEVRLHSGVRLFRTYNFQVLINVDYAVTFNDFDDRAIVFTIGLLR